VLVWKHPDYLAFANKTPSRTHPTPGTWHNSVNIRLGSLGRLDAPLSDVGRDPLT